MSRSQLWVAVALLCAVAGGGALDTMARGARDKVDHGARDTVDRGALDTARGARDTADPGVKGLWSPLLDWVLLARDKKVMRDPMKIVSRPPQQGGGGGGGVSETDMYLLGAIEKLVYRMDFMEKRLKRAEEMLYVVMAGSNDKVGIEPCPTNFTRVGRNCYHFSQRHYNWKSSASMCKSLGSTLAEMETIEENQDVVTYIQAHPDLRGQDYWTGGLNPGLLWIWAHSARPVASNATAPGAFDSIRGNGRCLRLAFNPALQAYNYLGADCAGRASYVCEYEENATGRALDRLAKQMRGLGPLDED